MYLKKLTALTLLFLAIFCVSGVSATLQRAGLRTVVNESGWEITGLARSQVFTSRKPFEPYVGAEKVNVTVLQPAHETVAQIPIYWLTDNGSTLRLKQQGVAIRSISRFDIDDRVFCYALRGVGAFYDEKTHRGGYGGSYLLIYYDTDGDGKFESFKLGDSSLQFIPTVPQWLTKNQSR